jgi:hypothetical protein
MGYLLSLSKSATGTLLLSCEWLMVLASALLVVGIFGEYGKIPQVRWIKFSKELCAVLVMVGVGGELFMEAGVVLFSHSMQTIQDAEANELRTRLVWQGPRDIPIESAQALFDENLKKLTGQKFRLSVCKNDIPPGAAILGNEEIMLAANALGNVLGRSGWIGVAEPPRQPIAVLPLMVDSCSSVAIFPQLRADAPGSARDAVKALIVVLDSVLMEGLDPDIPITGLSSSLPPDVIDIRVGRHPASPRPTPKK